MSQWQVEEVRGGVWERVAQQSGALDTREISPIISKADRKKREKATRWAFERNATTTSQLRAPLPATLCGDGDRALLDRVADRLDSCNKLQIVGKTDDGQWSTMGTIHCHSRLCPICANGRAQKWESRFFRWLDEESATMWIDGNGRAMSDRSRNEIYEQLAADLQLKGHTDPETLQRLMDRADGEAAHYRRKVYHHFVTLTIPNPDHLWDGTLEDPNLLDKLLLIPFKKLWEASRVLRRRRKEGKRGPKRDKRVKGLTFISRWLGYVGVAEITFNEAEQTYHPHLHLLVTSQVKRLPEKSLLHTWQHYAGDDVQIVDVKPVVKPSSIGAELLKYMTKVGEIDDPHAVQEIARATYRKRLIRTGGLYFGVRQSKVLEEEKRLQRMRDGVIAEKGIILVRNWTGDGWEYRIARKAGPDLPVQTEERLANPPTQDENNEVTPQSWAYRPLFRWDVRRRGRALHGVWPSAQAELRRRERWEAALKLERGLKMRRDQHALVAD